MARKKQSFKKQLEQRARKLVVSANPRSVVSEQFRTLRSNITFSAVDKELKTILVTSALPGDGKSTVSANLATLFAQDGKRVLFIDADMRKPTVQYTFSLTNAAGLSSVLTQQRLAGEVIRESEISPNLHILTSGPIPPNPAELLGSRSMTLLMNEMAQQYDLIVFDAPSVLSVTDAQILANKVDGTLLVVNTGVTEKDNVDKAKELLGNAKARILGAVMNNFKLDNDHYYYQYYGTEE
ncbi:CpsD/CapB family tyrosine-protein kinase [Bhargavaea beijingensis]|uniref:non-specific protein-tyrosine kinase n=1 Tax=Bhargavaea beijingensis TaxID=426756 RepID=A0ABX9ZDL9_9BACL|nr:CpsD/CapB family tyrosine-protein kinase [Bhargavaea beijingensis]RSK33688.1 polysaccharide biosynthesis tyrosine autokinase [Bhargavaea beijingensis]